MVNAARHLRKQGRDFTKRRACVKKACACAGASFEQVYGFERCGGAAIYSREGRQAKKPALFIPLHTSMELNRQKRRCFAAFM
jgi:hypothetical protein